MTRGTEAQVWPIPLALSSFALAFSLHVAQSVASRRNESRLDALSFFLEQVEAPPRRMHPPGSLIINCVQTPLEAPGLGPQDIGMINKILAIQPNILWLRLFVGAN
jgi:hypothetical protein